MKTLCDFCHQPLSVLIETIDEMFFDKWTCSRCVGKPIYIFKDALHIRNEFWFPKTFNTKNEVVMCHVVRTNFISLIHFINHITFATEILSFQNSYYKTIYESNEVSHITPQNVKHKLGTILTFL